ncbi:MAG: EamA family transporter [Patescibacteria group bacterium]|nr:MAG: EamA family transporter [Patescibacteria group bacterium]
MISKHRLKAYIYLSLVAFIWGVAGPVIKFTLGGIPSLPFLAYRFGLSSIASLITFKFISVKHIKISQWLLIIIYGLFASTFSLLFLFLGLEKTTMLDTALITTLNPLLISTAGALIFKDKITSREKLGTFIVVLGTIIAVIQPLLEKENLSQLQGNIFVVFYLLTNTIAALLAKKLTKMDISPIFVANLSFIIGFLTILPLAILKYPNTISSIVQLDIKYHLGVWFMALMSGNLAYTLWVRGQKSIEISEASLFTYLQLLFSTPLAIIWLGEKTNPTFLVGAFLILTGVIIAETKKRTSEL